MAKLGLLALAALGGTAQAAETLTLQQALQATLARLPELQAAPQRRDAAAAVGRAARAWTPEPAAFETSFKSGSSGTRELAAGVAVPLWLPGQRAGTQALAQAEQQALDAQLAAARLRAAATLREAWWALHAAREDEALAQARQDHAGALAADVARRVQAGDLARADHHQAEAALAAAQAERAVAQAVLQRAAASLRGLVGRLDAASAQSTPEPLPEIADATALAAHPALLALQARAALARRTAELARLQSRAAPELALAATRERGAAGEAYGQTLSIGLRLPFGQDDRHQARQAAAGADETEAQAQLAAERERIADQIELAQAGVVLAREAATAAARRATLAQEAQGFQDKAFRLGQNDLPTRLRSAFEAFEARRHAARAGVALAQAISQWRQALGLLPE